MKEPIVQSPWYRRKHTKNKEKIMRVLLREKQHRKNGWNRGLEGKKEMVDGVRKKEKENKFGTVGSEET